MKLLYKILVLSTIFTIISCDCFLGMGSGCDDDGATDLSTEFNVIIYDVQTSHNSSGIPPNSNTINVYFKLETLDGDPVADKSENFFDIYEMSNNEGDFKLISVNEAERKIDPNRASFKYFNTIVLDLSGSVINNDLNKLKEATSSFIENSYDNIAPENLNTALIWFDGRNQINVLQGYTTDRKLLLNKVDSITEDLPQDSSTNLNGAIIESITYMRTAMINASNSFITGGSILFFTDGTDQAGHYSTQEAVSAATAEMDFMDIYSIGLGNEIDESILSQIGYSGAFFPDSIDQLQAQFTQVANNIEQEANSYYLLQYCSPKRNGFNSLKIGIKNKGSEGGVAEFNASGFVDNCLIE